MTIAMTNRTDKVELTIVIQIFMLAIVDYYGFHGFGIESLIAVLSGINLIGWNQS